MKKEDFYIGQLVQVREWDDMAAEFGLGPYGIAGSTYFVKGMKKYCGQVFTVERIEQDCIRIDDPYNLSYGFGCFVPYENLKAINEEELLSLMA